MITTPSPTSAFEHECRRLLAMSGNEFLERMKTDDFGPEYNVNDVMYLMELIWKGPFTNGTNVSK